MKFEIESWLTGKVQCEVEIECLITTSAYVKLGLAVKTAYLTGADLTGADLTGADLTGADLTGADLTGAYLRGADLRDADLTGADLTGADLTGADLTGADLMGADLTGADLTGADLTGADLTGIPDIPVVPNIDATMLAAIEANKKTGTNGICMGSWHGDHDEPLTEENWCGTTHCRAGYAVCLAGKAGFELEAKVGTELAGILIYRASTPDAPCPNFYATDEEAMADIKARATKQQPEGEPL